MKKSGQGTFFLTLEQFVADGLVKIEASGVKKGTLLSLVELLRRRLIAFNDPLVRYKLDGSTLLLPLSHDLPRHRKRFPLYSSNIARIAKQINYKYPDLSIIDIGANVGDSAAILRGQVDCPILCIEGDEKFFSILQANAASFANVYPEHAFVGVSSGSFKGSFVSEGGTGSLRETMGSTELISTKTLSEILKTHQAFAGSKMLKIDTDGFDVQILCSELDFLARNKSIIFFEYDPSLVRQPEQHIKIFKDLRDIGYGMAIFYENNGDYLLTAELSNEPLIEDLHHFYSGRSARRYCDVCVYHKEDADVCDATRHSEITFFDNYRQRSNAAVKVV